MWKISYTEILFIHMSEAEVHALKMMWHSLKMESYDPGLNSGSGLDWKIYLRITLRILSASVSLPIKSYKAILIWHYELKNKM